MSSAEESDACKSVLAVAKSKVRRLTVLGGAGFVGNHFIRKMQQEGFEVSSPAKGDESFLDSDLGYVIYAVGLTADYAKRPFETVEAHVGLLSRVLARGRFQSLVYLSSTRLYDGTAGVAREANSLHLHPSNPRHIFDLSKALGESLCLQTGKAARVARLSSVYADDLSGNNFLHTLVRASAARCATLDTSPALARDYIDVDDVTTALLAIATQGRRPIYNVASGRNITNAEVIDLLRREGGDNVALIRETPTETAPVIDVSALAEDFGVRPRPLSDRVAALLKVARGEVR